VVTVAEVDLWLQQQEQERRLNRERKQNMGVAPKRFV
jgi:hypothetical protein